MELPDHRSYDHLSRLDVTLSCSKVYEGDSTTRNLLEATSLLDWWRVAAQLMVLPLEVAKCHQVFLTGIKDSHYDLKDCFDSMGACVRGEILCVSKVSLNITYEHKMEMQKVPVFLWFELHHMDAVLQAMEKSSSILRDKAIKRAFPFDC